MDFGTLLSVAQKNELRQTSKACYQTKFTPPKKESKQSKSLSDNIKKFLARKEEEERRKVLEEKKKKENLLALRDHKAQSRINKHLKVCKAANKSVLADAIDNENTAVTIAGPSQCDEDDYGYVSQEASAFYNKLMNKYSSLPPEKPLFSNDGKKTVKDIASTKDRVRQALKQQELEESLPHRRKRKCKESEVDNKRMRDIDDFDRYKDKDGEKDRERDKELENEEKPRPKKKSMPPPIDFSDLLKLAEKKQYEPIKIEPKPKPKEEPERLMTKKQMKEYAKEKDWREKKEQRIRNPEAAKSVQSTNDSNKIVKPTLTKCSKLSSAKSTNDVNHEKTVKSLPIIVKKSVDRPVEKNYNLNRPAERNNIVHKSTEKSSTINKSMERSNNASKSIEKTNSVNKSLVSKISEKDVIAQERRKLEEEKRQLAEMRRSIEEEKKKLLMNKTKKIEENKANDSPSHKSMGSKIKDAVKPSSSLPKNVLPKQGLTNNVKSKLSLSDVKARQFPPADTKPKQFPPSDVKSKQFPPSDVKPRQFPPPDVRSSKPDSSKHLKVSKGRIYDEDDDEYDSDFDDFIDDGPVDDCEDYSKYISQIFGYDKNKYRQEDDEDDVAMESNFAQQLKEEFVSTKIGIMEDLEDIRQEAYEKKRKALLKKNRKM